MSSATAFCTALISELVRKRIPDGRTGDRKWPTKCRTTDNDNNISPYHRRASPCADAPRGLEYRCDQYVGLLISFCYTLYA